MTAYTEQQRRWAAIGYHPPIGRDRCPACHWHTPTQGHINGCPREETR